MARSMEGAGVSLTLDLHDVVVVMGESGARDEFTPNEARRLAARLIEAAQLADDFRAAAKSPPMLRSVP